MNAPVLLRRRVVSIQELALKLYAAKFAVEVSNQPQPSQTHRVGHRPLAALRLCIPGSHQLLQMLMLLSQRRHYLSPRRRQKKQKSDAGKKRSKVLISVGT